jgi:hypothetical protein
VVTLLTIDAQHEGRFGDTCKFSHDLTPGESSSRRAQGGSPSRRTARGGSPSRRTAQEAETVDDYYTWKVLLRNRHGPQDASTRQKFWDGALKILDGNDRDRKQQLPKDLDDNEKSAGLLHIKALMEHRAQTVGSSLVQVYRVSQSFLLVVTHTAMLDCLSVDTYVGSLYNFMSGPSGMRAIPFFQ